MNVTDRRRLLGPPNVKYPLVDVLAWSAAVPKVHRANDKIRKMFLKTGLVGNSNGSAFLEVDGTIVEVSIFGPRPIRGSFIDRASFSVESKFLPHIPQPNDNTFNSQPNAGSQVKTGLTIIEQKISSYIETAFLHSIMLEKYPKSTIDVFVTIISASTTPDSNKSILNLCNWVANCTSLALVDAGIEMKDMVTSGQVSLNRRTYELILDPDYASFESESEDTTTYVDCVCSYMNMMNDVVVGFWVEGNHNELDPATMQKLFDNCNLMSKKIRNNFNAYLKKSLD